MDFHDGTMRQRSAKCVIHLEAEQDTQQHAKACAAVEFQNVHFRRWMGSVHAITYGVTEQVELERDGGLRELRRRIRRVRS